MLTSIAVVCLATLYIVSAQIQHKDPSACDNCVKRYEIGFNPHPYDPTQFIQCFFKGRGVVEPVYRSCDWGEFWDHAKLRCRPAKDVNSEHDKCKDPKVKYYKHSDPNKCGAYWVCKGGRAHPACCPEGQAFHPVKGCMPSGSCTDMCPDRDRVPGCDRSPISGSPTQYLQYIGDGDWKKVKCDAGAAYNPADCACTYKDIVKVGRRCKPDVKINFNQIKQGKAVDLSGNNYQVTTENVQFYQDAAYFNGKSKLNIPPFKPSAMDEGVLVIKMKYKERYQTKAYNTLQAMVTNGHCQAKESVMIGKMPGFVLVGAECKETSRTFMLPTVKKPWKEVIYIHDGVKLESRVCGAVKNEWSYGPLKSSNCGLQVGMAKGMHGFVGLIDDIEIYRCKPLDSVININY